MIDVPLPPRILTIIDHVIYWCQCFSTGEERVVSASDRRISKPKAWSKMASMVVVDLALEESLALGD